jgi:hypothetical protein
LFCSEKRFPEKINSALSALNGVAALNNVKVDRGAVDESVSIALLPKCTQQGFQQIPVSLSLLTSSFEGKKGGKI